MKYITYDHYISRNGAKGVDANDACLVADVQHPQVGVAAQHVSEVHAAQSVPLQR